MGIETIIISALWPVLRDLARSAVKAAVPLVSGSIAALVAGVLYIFLIGDNSTGEFFSAAAQVAIGVLVALVVEQRLSPALGDEFLARQARAGTVALTAAGTAAALAGGLLSGTGQVASIGRGVAFALAWGGITAGVIGLLIFVGPTSDRVAMGETGANAANPVD